MLYGHIVTYVITHDCYGEPNTISWASIRHRSHLVNRAILCYDYCNSLAQVAMSQLHTALRRRNILAALGDALRLATHATTAAEAPRA